jgi:hypothetical protein
MLLILRSIGEREIKHLTIPLVKSFKVFQNKDGQLFTPNKYILYIIYKTNILLKCLGLLKILLVMFEVHEGIYRAYQSRIKIR